MMKKLIAYLFLLISLNAQAQTNTDSVRRVFGERIQKVMKKHNIVGANVAVVTTDSVLWIDNFGYADKAEGLGVNDTILFALGSVTKVFTAIATMQVNENGLIDLDKPFSNYLPSFNPKDEHADLVTARNILTHHSGLPSDVFKGMFSHQPEDYKVVVDYINNEPLAFTPGKIRAYSNPAYTLLGHMVSHQTNMVYEDFIKQKILSPLDMIESDFNIRDKASKTYDKKGEEQVDVLLRDVPAGGLYSNGAEMSKFLMGMLQQRQDLLTVSSYYEMLNTDKNSSSLDMNNQYGLGWNTVKRPFAGKIFYHTGTTLYANAMIAFSPEAGLGVVILTNSENGSRLFKEGNSLLEALAKEKGLPKNDLEVASELGSKKRIKLPNTKLQKHEGIYATPGAYIKVYTKRSKLFMRIQGIKAELIPVAENTFVPKPILIGFIPIKLNETRMYFEEIDGHYLLTQLELGGNKELLCERIELSQISNKWKDRAGNYELINELPGEIPYFHDYAITVKEGLVLFAFKQKGSNQTIEMPLEILNDDEAKTAGLGRYAGQHLQAKNDTIKIFGLELKKTIK